MIAADEVWCEKIMPILKLIYIDGVVIHFAIHSETHEWKKERLLLNVMQKGTTILVQGQNVLIISCSLAEEIRANMFFRSENYNF